MEENSVGEAVEPGLSAEELAAQAAAAEAARKEAERLERIAQKEREAEAAIQARIALKAEERRIELEQMAAARAKAEAEKIRRAEEAAAFLEAKRKQQAEEDEKKRILEEERARKAEERRVRQKKIDDRNAFLAQQAKRAVPEGLGQIIRNACARGDIEAIKAYVQEWDGNAVLEEKDRDQWSPLFWCCKKGCAAGALSIMGKWVSEFDMEEDIKKLWQRRLEVHDDEGMTMMHHAAVSGCTELVKFFLSKGNSKSSVNEDGFTAVHLAAYQGHTETVRALVEALSPIDLRTRGAKTALQCAIVGGCKETIEFLTYAEDLRGLRSV